MDKVKAENKLKKFLSDNKESIVVQIQGKFYHTALIDNVILEGTTMNDLQVGIIAGGFYRVFPFSELQISKEIKDYVRNTLNQTFK